MTFSPRLPLALTEYVQRGGGMAEEAIHLVVLGDTHPFVPEDERITITEIAPHLPRRRPLRLHGRTRRGALHHAGSEAGLTVPLQGAIVVTHSSRVLVMHSPECPDGPAPLRVPVA